MKKGAAIKKGLIARATRSGQPRRKRRADLGARNQAPDSGELRFMKGGLGWKLNRGATMRAKRTPAVGGLEDCPAGLPIEKRVKIKGQRFVKPQAYVHGALCSQVNR